jgi:predicted Fe-Mo cluster-binding NifX family protein
MNKTKVAIPVFRTQVSPRCDCAPEMLFLEFENGEVVSRSTTAMEGMTSHQIIRAISASGVTLLVCGALPCFYRRMVDSLGIQIIHAEGMTIDVLIGLIKQGEFTSSVPRWSCYREEDADKGCGVAYQKKRSWKRSHE